MRWVLTIQDSGPGMTSEALPPAGGASGRAVTPLSSERHEGLGLPIVRRLCLLLDAHVEVRSKKGEGTTFTVTFPGEIEP
jgi:signal transduction histidine kinase